LVTGGTQNDDAGLNSTELNDPSTEIWTNTGSMNYGRSLYTVSVLADGKVLGSVEFNDKDRYLSSAELYDLSK
jgi:hypothetical protein